MKHYELKKKDVLKSSIFAVALVSEPAIEVDFVYLSKNEPINFAFQEEKGMIYSPVLIPDKKIPRKGEDGEAFTVSMSADTIEELARDYIKAGNLVGNWNSEHNEFQKLSGVTVVESWIIEDPATDKSANFPQFKGLPKGTWMFGIHVENDAIKQEIKSGKYKGISIEGDLERQLTKFSKSTNTMDMAKDIADNVFTRLSKVLKLNEEAPKEKFGKIDLEEGTLYFEGEELTETTVLYIDEAMSQVAPTGEHKLNDGRAIVIGENGVFSELKEGESEEMSNAELAAKAAEKALTENAELKDQIEEMSKANAELKEKFEKLSKTTEEHTQKLSKVKAPASVTKLERTKDTDTDKGSKYHKRFHKGII